MPLACPRCLSMNVSLDLSNVTTVLGGGVYRCSNCGYSGAIVAEVGEEG